MRHQASGAVGYCFIHIHQSEYESGITVFAQKSAGTPRDVTFSPRANFVLICIKYDVNIPMQLRVHKVMRKLRVLLFGGNLLLTDNHLRLRNHIHRGPFQVSCNAAMI
jgi:hypothetical protein